MIGLRIHILYGTRIIVLYVLLWMDTKLDHGELFYIFANCL